jgi:hypothetical protein
MNYVLGLGLSLLIDKQLRFHTLLAIAPILSGFRACRFKHVMGHTGKLTMNISDIVDIAATYSAFTAGQSQSRRRNDPLLPQ